MDLTKMNAALQELRSKYAVANNGEIIAAPCGDMGAGAILKCCCGKSIPLLPWRKERRFFELKNLVDTNTLEDVSTLRFAWIASEKTLPQLLYRELDLCEYIGESPIVSIFATLGGDKTANAIVKLADTKSCSVECSAGLPKGAEEIDKHEIIARRGIGCDRVVDSQIPMSSIYEFTQEGEKRFTDVDTELYGFSTEEIWLIRAAFEVLAKPELADIWIKADTSIRKKVAAALETEKNGAVALFGKED